MIFYWMVFTPVIDAASVCNYSICNVQKVLDKIALFLLFIEILTKCIVVAELGTVVSLWPSSIVYQRYALARESALTLRRSHMSSC